MLFGVGKRVNNFVYLFLDAMIGGGVVYDGDVLRGTNSNAGGLALMRVDSPGQSSLLLEHTPLFLLLNKLSKAGIKKPKTTQLSEDSSEQRQICDQWVEQAAPALSLAVIDIHSLLDTEAVVLTSRLPRELMQYFIQLMEVILEQEYQLDLGQSLPKLLEEGNRSDFHALAAAMVPYYQRYATTFSILLRQTF